MEVIPLIRSSATGSESSKGDNGIKRHVQEWSRMDRLTGILEHARVEADQWTNHTANTKHKYGKVVDRRARNLADGSKEETQQTKQLEVFQTHTAGCSVQVIRSQTSTTTSSWHNSSAGSTNAFGQWPPSVFDKKDDSHFDQLRLEHSPLLDVSSQKNKASVGRSGSISTRRPPTRRPQAVVAADDDAADDTTAVSRRHHLRDSADEPVSTNLNRIKSCSSDEIRSDVCTAESDEPLDRCSRFRRSLQFAQSKQADGSGPRTAAAGELENVLKRVLGKKLRAVDGDAAVGEGSLIRPAASPKKPSFITVESLKKTKNSLRHLEPQDGDACCRDDDGIETDAKVAGDSRSLDYNRSSALTRTEEWYNRRKSYGFEKVSAADRGKGRDAEPSAVGSSTDSGICRSTENGLSNSSRQSSVDRESIADLVKKYSAGEINNNNTLQAHAYNTAVVAKGKILEAINSLRSKSSAYFDVVAKPNDVVPASGENEDREQQAFTRRLSVGVDVAVDSDKDNIPKRHSIAVVSEVADPNVDKKNASKKVEFCRTEVHFDTTPGKINIVDMEDKPAPAQLYRPKKRYSRPPEKNRGLPEYRFGDEVTQQHPHEAVVASQTNGDDDESRATTTTTAEDDGAAAEDSGSSVPRSILKRQQQQQQNGGDGGPGGTASDNGIEVRISSTESTPVDCRRASWSVADRVRQVEAVGFSTRVNFTEGGETTAVGFDPAADPKKYRYSYDGTASPVWYQNNGNPAAAAADAASSAAATKCHEKLLVRIGTSGASGGGGAKANATDRPCAFSECFGTASEPLHRLSSTSLVLRNAARQPRGGGGAATAFPRDGTKDARWQDRLRKTPSTSWPRCGHRTHPAARRHDDAPLKGRRADVRDRAAPAAAGGGDGMPDVIGALDDLSKKIEEQIVRDQHVTLIEVRQSPAAADHRGDVLRSARGRLEYVKDLMSTDETSEESLKADEEVRSYMMAADDDDDDDDNRPEPNRTPSECENLKKLVSTVKKNVKRSRCSQENRSNKPESFNEAAPPPPPNVTSVLLNHEKPSEEERSQFQPVTVHTAQVTHVVKHRFDDDVHRKKQAASSKRVPVKIVQDNRKTKQKTEIAKTEAPVAKMCATVSLKQVPMTVQQPKLVGGDKKKIMSEKKESSTACGNVGGHRVLHHNAAARAKDKPATVTAASAPAHKQAQQDLFSTGRDSWLNMPRDLGPKLNRSKGTAHGCKSGRPGRKEPTAESDVSVLEELNRAADEILKAVNGYTDDESVHASNEPKTRSGGGGGGAAAADRAEAKLKNRKKAARLLQRANSREALLHLDEASSSDEEVAADEMAHCRPAKPKAQRKAAGRPTAADSVANKTTASFTKKIQSRAQNATTTANVQHKIHPTCYGNVSSNTQSGPIKLRNKPSNTVAKQLVDQKDSRAGRYQCKITSRTFGSKKSKCAVEENKNSIKGC